MKNLPDSRTNSYPHSFDLYESSVTNQIYGKNETKKKVKLPNFKSIKKDDLIKLLEQKCTKIDELETTVFHLKNDLNKITGQYKKLKADNCENERDSKYLNNTVSNGIDNMRQLMSKIENELSKIKPEFC